MSLPVTTTIPNVSDIHLVNTTTDAIDMHFNCSSNYTCQDIFDNCSYPSDAPNPMTVITMTMIYVIIFILGFVGNTVTCIVIIYNRYMHTSTNYYLFNMSVSDLLLLITGLPFELYSFWEPDNNPYVFGEAFCLLRGLCAETSNNASILTIVFFTVERYMAICHPLIQQTMSSLTRTLRNVAVIWFISLACACFPTAQFGLDHQNDVHGALLENTAECTVVRNLFPKVFEVMSIAFFVVPMLVITVLYVRIGMRLRRKSGKSSLSRRCPQGSSTGGGVAARRAVIKMLVAVVVVFFICYAPFHAQRLLASSLPACPSVELKDIMTAVLYVTGVLYFVSTCTNPILYHVMSAKFRQAVQDTFLKPCRRICCKAGCRGPSQHPTAPSTEVSMLATSGAGAEDSPNDLKELNLTSRDHLLSRQGTAATCV